jgi:hypothetical protein
MSIKPAPAQQILHFSRPRVRVGTPPAQPLSAMMKMELPRRGFGHQSEK